MSNWIRDGALLAQGVSQAQMAGQLQAQTQLMAAQQNLMVIQHNQQLEIAELRRYLTAQEFNTQTAINISSEFPAYARHAILTIQQAIQSSNLESRFMQIEDLQYLNRVKVMVSQSLQNIPNNHQVNHDASLLTGELNFRMDTGNIEPDNAAFNKLQNQINRIKEEVKKMRLFNYVKMIGLNVIPGLLFGLIAMVLLFGGGQRLGISRDFHFLGGNFFLFISVMAIGLSGLTLREQKKLVEHRLKIMRYDELSVSIPQKLSQLGCSNFSDFLNLKNRWRESIAHIKIPNERIHIQGVIV